MLQSYLVTILKSVGLCSNKCKLLRQLHHTVHSHEKFDRTTCWALAKDLDNLADKILSVFPSASWRLLLLPQTKTSSFVACLVPPNLVGTTPELRQELVYSFDNLVIYEKEQIYYDYVYQHYEFITYNYMYFFDMIKIPWKTQSTAST